MTRRTCCACYCCCGFDCSRGRNPRKGNRSLRRRLGISSCHGRVDGGDACFPCRRHLFPYLSGVCVCLFNLAPVGTAGEEESGRRECAARQCKASLAREHDDPTVGAWRRRWRNFSVVVLQIQREGGEERPRRRGERERGARRLEWGRRGSGQHR
jgi:hypothetical protein